MISLTLSQNILFTILTLGLLEMMWMLTWGDLMRWMTQALWYRVRQLLTFWQCQKKDHMLPAWGWNHGKGNCREVTEATVNTCWIELKWIGEMKKCRGKNAFSRTFATQYPFPLSNYLPVSIWVMNSSHHMQFGRGANSRDPGSHWIKFSLFSPQHFQA